MRRWRSQGPLLHKYVCIVLIASEARGVMIRVMLIVRQQLELDVVLSNYTRCPLMILCFPSIAGFADRDWCQ
ncbi:uncharacterized protein F5147DRAFT_663878 [Suillus discolor]|uniref:Uncharacterized protein n=1 Tax=Suillus discolor TaxID=1912936 RepID=A0A9P7K0S2_9AGAM|nr:uncharacterized protein F5147DRAFT_663878 [Suillus discolor]KAG2120977.1 hypothetical protein F5147DRAFT_663878 [Suillus discolor]